MGVDIANLGANTNSSKANAAAGVRTLAGSTQDYNEMADTRDFKYTQGQDKIADEKWQKEFDRILKQDGVQEALAWAGNAISQQNANTSAYSAATSRESLNWSKDPSNPDNIYKNKQIEELGKEKPGAYDQDPDWPSEISEINSDPEGQYDWLLKNSDAYIAKYTYDGYQKLLSQAKSQIE
jgi:hypothetical protein